MIYIKKGMNLPISGALNEANSKHVGATKYVAVVGVDYLGLRPSMKVEVGSSVQKGQVLFEDKKNPGVVFTAPQSGVVRFIERGERRRLLSVVIEVNDDKALSFQAYSQQQLSDLSDEQVREQLLSSGAWTALRTRPYSKIPHADSRPHSIFINTMNSNPLAFDPTLALQGREADYQAGLTVLAKLTDGFLHVCKKPDSILPECHDEKIKVHEFDGVHPAGLAGTHIHFIDPVHEEKTVWYLGLQDLLAIGRLFLSGELDSQRMVALGGPGLKQPQLLVTCLGADLNELLEKNLKEGELRIISGSVLSGRQTCKQTAYLGRYDEQVSVLFEGREKIFIEFMRPGKNKFSITSAYLGHFAKKKFAMTTTTNGSPRPMVPIGVYEQVMPLDILPTLLLKSLIVKDTDTAKDLGCLELDEEDLALCSYVCPGKYDYGAILRENLTQIEQDG